MKPLKLTDRLPQTEATRPVMAHVSSQLADGAKKQMKKDNIGWKELIEAAIIQYLEESKK